MSEADEVVAVIREWVGKAEEDLTSAEHNLELREKCPLTTICYHAQQCVEKYLKALLVLRGIDFPKTHNIPEIVALLPAADRPCLPEEEQERLTDYATVTRYPGDYAPLTRAAAEEAASIARRVRDEMRARLPKEAVA